MKSPCREVTILARVVAKDIRMTTARNLSMLEAETGGLTWASPGTLIKRELAERVPVVPPVDSWRIPYLGRLLEERDRLAYQGKEDCQEFLNAQELIDSLCSN